MAKLLVTVPIWLVGFLVAGALAIGAQAAFARPVAMVCPNNGSTLLGSCVDTPDCQHKCDLVWGAGNSTGICSGTPGCCRCLI